jgi:hypothetical protein
MKKLFFALTLSLVGLFFSNFIIPSSEDVEKTEIVNSMLPYQTISITNNNEEKPAQVTIINGYNGSGGTTNFTLGLGQSWQGSFTGNVLSVTILLLLTLVSIPHTKRMQVHQILDLYVQRFTRSEEMDQRILLVLQIITIRDC